MRILVLGATGMLGNAVLRLFAASPGFSVMGAARSARATARLSPEAASLVATGLDVENADGLVRLVATTRPDAIVNCIGLVKQHADAHDPLLALSINALVPHRLAHLAQLAGARLVHVSTDCVFSGTRGNYTEADVPDATDLYGRSKLMGEVDRPNAVTLRTSIIGHELETARGLVGWFLAQSGEVRGFTRAMFAGLPAVTLARLIRDQVLPRTDMRGVWHVSAQPIAKHDLLVLLRDAYARRTRIVRDDALVIDRSLDSTRFRAATGWTPPPWPELVAEMRAFG